MNRKKEDKNVKSNGQKKRVEKEARKINKGKTAGEERKEEGKNMMIKSVRQS